MFASGPIVDVVAAAFSSHEDADGPFATFIGTRYQLPLSEASQTQLSEALYATAHCRLSSDPWERDARGSDHVDGRDFARLLSEANSGVGSWQQGWTIREALFDGRILAESTGLRFWCLPAEFRGPEAAARPGDRGRVFIPKEYRQLVPGFYMATGDADDDMEGAATVRVYWNVTARGAVSLVAQLTRALNDARIPFRFKTHSDPRNYGRADSAVLYLRRELYDAAAPLLEGVASALRGQLTAAVPRFAKELAPGVSIAEDPGDGSSFGQHRSRLLAAALAAEEVARAATPTERAKVLRALLARDGYDPDALFLNPGSSDKYPAFAVVPAMTDPEVAALVRAAGQRSTRGAGQWLATAAAIARHLCASAYREGARCTWMGTTQAAADDGDDLEFTYGTLGPDLYGGTSGVALFLCEVGLRTGEREALDASERAIRHALGRAALVPRPARLGFYSGTVGVAYAAARIGRALDRPEFLAGAAALLTDLPIDDDVSVALDVVSGAAGAAPVLLTLADWLGEPQFRSIALRLGDRLLRSATPQAAGGFSWADPGDEATGAPDLTGFSHGAAGMGWSLFALYRATGDARILHGAEQAFQYEGSWFRGTVDNWPDFRESTAPGDPAPCGAAWCHGAPGIGLSRVRAMAISPAEIHRADAAAALRTCVRTLEALGADPHADGSLCHGRAGLCELTLELAGALHDEHAARVALDAAAYAAECHATSPAEWPCGVARGSNPSLMLGLAGIGYSYLRLADPTLASVLVPGG